MAPTARSERGTVTIGVAYRLTQSLRRTGAVLLCLGLGACTYFEETYQPPCPRAAVVDDAKAVSSFRDGPGRDLTDILYEGLIVGVGGDCSYHEDGYVEADLSVRFNLSIGPALEDGIGRWQYFVVILDPDGQRIAKKVFNIELAFEQASSQTGLMDLTTQRISYSPWPDARGYRILVGFQLTREELDYLRSRIQ